MEFEFMTTECALPCLVVADDDNGRYMIQNVDRSGEVFNSKEELLEWIEVNWRREMLVDPEAYDCMVKELKESVLLV